jgi:hypothetical protein
MDDELEAEAIISNSNQTHHTSESPPHTTGSTIHPDLEPGPTQMSSGHTASAPATVSTGRKQKRGRRTKAKLVDSSASVSIPGALGVGSEIGPAVADHPDPTVAVASPSLPISTHDPESAFVARATSNSNAVASPNTQTRLSTSQLPASAAPTQNGPSHSLTSASDACQPTLSASSRSSRARKTLKRKEPDTKAKETGPSRKKTKGKKSWWYYEDWDGKPVDELGNPVYVDEAGQPILDKNGKPFYVDLEGNPILC